MPYIKYIYSCKYMEGIYSCYLEGDPDRNRNVNDGFIRNLFRNHKITYNEMKFLLYYNSVCYDLFMEVSASVDCL